MRLYHLTSIAKTKRILADGLKPHLNVPRIGRERREDFINDSKLKWYVTAERVHTIGDLRLWEKSKELGRLLYFILQNEAPPDMPEYFSGFSLLSFTTKQNDGIYVCEADWLRKYHEHELDTFDTHIRFAQSRVSIEEYGEYKLNYSLPEFLVSVNVNPTRIEELAFPGGLEPIRLETRLDHFITR